MAYTMKEFAEREIPKDESKAERRAEFFALADSIGDVPAVLIDHSGIEDEFWDALSDLIEQHPPGLPSEYRVLGALPTAGVERAVEPLAITPKWVYFTVDGKLKRKAKMSCYDRELLGPPVEPGELVVAIAAEYGPRAADEDDLAVKTSKGRIMLFSGYRCEWTVLTLGEGERPPTPPPQT